MPFQMWRNPKNSCRSIGLDEVVMCTKNNTLISEIDLVMNGSRNSPRGFGVAAPLRRRTRCGTNIPPSPSLPKVLTGSFVSKETPIYYGSQLNYSCSLRD